MDTRQRYQNIFDFFQNTRQMIFVSGPRQCGKTTFAKRQLRRVGNGTYLNWDIAGDRRKILENSDLSEVVDLETNARSLVVLDEIHKFSEWKNFLKGVYDEHSDRVKLLVTGSGRLDMFKKGKDSLAGRYFLFHMWPLTIAEFGKKLPSVDQFVADPFSLPPTASSAIATAWHQMARCSGFPDPFFAGSEKLYRVWSDTYRNQLIREDIRQLTKLEKLDLVEKMVLLLPLRVGSTLSIDNVAQDLQVAFDTVKKWLLVLERFFITFRLQPWSAKITRSITKEQKLYFYDYAQIADAGAKFENMVALDLLRAVNTWRELGEGSWDLRYVRDRDGREVDFLLVKDGKPFLLVEAKHSDTNPSPSLKLFQQKMKIPGVQLVNQPNVKRVVRNDGHEIVVSTAWDWLSNLP